MMSFALLFLVSSALLPTAFANHVDLKIDDDFRGDFDQDLVVKLYNPTDVQISPNGSLMMVSNKHGALYVVEEFESDNPKTTEALEIKKICTNQERGLSGCAFHPDFGKSNRFIYLYYTYDKYDDCDSSGNPNKGPVNRLSRFILGDDLKVDNSTEEVFFDTPIMPKGTHNSGNIAFGRDGYLYVSVGDGGSLAVRNDAGVRYPQALDMLLGKILRLTEDGDIPPTNPYVNDDESERCNGSGWASEPNKKCQEIYSYGLRNPFRFAMDVNSPNKTRFFLNDVGRLTWESIREGGDGLEGVNYGHPEREGPCKKKMATGCKPPDESQGITDPIHWWLHDKEDGGAVTGGAFYPNDAGWNPSFQNSYLYADYAFGGIYRMIKGESTGCAYPKCDPPVSPYADSVKVVSDYRRVTSIRFGPYNGGQALYVATRGHTGNYGDMGIFRLSYTGSLYAADGFSTNADATNEDDTGAVAGGDTITIPVPAPILPRVNRAPKAVLTADITLGFSPMTVNFEATESFDPDNGDSGFALTYEWDFNGDGEIDSVQGPTVKHTYTKSGTYFASVTIYDSEGLPGDVAKLMIDVKKSPPQPVIMEPEKDASFAVGDVIRLVGAAMDADGGPPLPDKAFTWEVRMHHVDHYHVMMQPTVGNHLELPSAPDPVDLETAKDSYLSVLLTATDSTGLSMSTETIVRPKMVDLSFVTVPSGLILAIDGEEYTSPVSLTTWENHRFDLEAPTQRKDFSNSKLQAESTTYVWESWSDGEDQRHEFVAPSTERNVVANFQTLKFQTAEPRIRSSEGNNGEPSTFKARPVALAMFISINVAGIVAIVGFVGWMPRKRKMEKMEKDGKCGSIEHAPTHSSSKPSYFGTCSEGSDIEQA